MQLATVWLTVFVWNITTAVLSENNIKKKKRVKRTENGIYSSMNRRIEMFRFYCDETTLCLIDNQCLNCKLYGKLFRLLLLSMRTYGDGLVSMIILYLWAVSPHFEHILTNIHNSKMTKS